MHDFHYSGAQLCCEGVTLEALARKFGTPLYVYSQHTLEDRFQQLDTALAAVDQGMLYLAARGVSTLSGKKLARLEVSPMDSVS